MFEPNFRFPSSDDCKKNDITIEEIRRPFCRPVGSNQGVMMIDIMLKGEMDGLEASETINAKRIY